MSETKTNSKPSKAMRKKIAGMVIDKYQDGGVFSDEDCQTMSDLCGYNFHQVIKKTKRMISVVCPSESYAGTWSWNKSIDGYNEDKNTIQAMRSASRKGSFSNHTKSSCENCGSLSNLTVDHKSTPFKEIAKQYTAIHGSPETTNIDGFGWVLRNERQFIDYHDSIADYQTLCQSCNSSKGSN